MGCCISKRSLPLTRRRRGGPEGHRLSSTKEAIMFWIRAAIVAELFLGAAAVVGAEAGSDTTAKRPPKVALLRVPDRGIQPQVAVDSRGVVHLIYFKGDPGAGDIFYVHSENE